MQGPGNSSEDDRPGSPNDNATRAKPAYTPNTIPTRQRVAYPIIALILFAYGSHGVYVGDLYLPGRHSRGMDLHGAPAWIMYAAIICACVSMLSVVVDHYDRRNNEATYHRIAKLGAYAGWTLFAAAALLGFIRSW